jgi:hypothetical protein
MKPKLVGLIAAIGLGAAGGALASGGGGAKAVVLLPGMAVNYAGLTCTAYAGSTPLNADLVCVRNNLLGYGVVVSQAQVIVAKSIAGKIKVFFRHANQ